MTLTVSNLVAALDQFPAYHAIDVFADDLAELRQPMPPSLHPLDAQGRGFLVTHQGRSFKLDIFPERGVARLSQYGLAPTATGAVTGALATSLVGAAIDAANKQKGAGLLGGALLGLLVGAALGGAAGDARRVFALTYDPQAGQWRAYDGGLLRWMKGQLAVNVACRVAPARSQAGALSRAGRGELPHRMLAPTYDALCGEPGYGPRWVKHQEIRPLSQELGHIIQRRWSSVIATTTCLRSRELS